MSAPPPGGAIAWNVWMSDLSPQMEERARFADFGGRRPTAFVDAGRHTARVQFLRRAIIIVCVSAVALIGFMLFFDPLHRLQLGFSVGHVGLEGTRITMDSPRLSGYRSDGQPYEIKAKRVVQDTRKPKIFELRDVEAKLGGADGSTTQIQSAKGRYNSENDMLDLGGGVRVLNAGRYDMKLESAVVDMRANRVRSDKPVVVLLPGGRVDAVGAALSESDHTISFIGPVKSTFADSSPEAPSPEAASSEASTPEAPAAQPSPQMEPKP